MALPSQSFTIKANGLGLVPASRAGSSVTLGICSDGVVGTFYSFGGDVGTAQTSLGQGPLIENVAEKQLLAGQAMAMPLNPTTAGALSAVSTALVAGAGVLTNAAGPAKTLDLKIITGGANGTATFSWRKNGGAYSAPILIAVGASTHLIPGTLTKVTFAAAQTWVANDVYTVATTGVVSLVGSGPAASNVTHVSSPLDAYDVRMTVTTTGAAGAGVFKYSVDGGNNTSGEILIPSGGRYAIPDTGVVLIFSGTFTALDVYSFTTTTASFGNSDVQTAITTLLGRAEEWRFIHIVGMGANVAAAASLGSAVDTLMTTAETQFRYVWTIVEVPTNGSPGGSTEADSAVAAGVAAFTSARVMFCAGDVQHQSVLTGRLIRRNLAVACSARIASKPLSVSPAEVGDPAEPLPRVKSLYRDEAATPALDAARMTTATSIIGETGYFITRGRMMAAAGSDFESVMNRSVVDEGCRLGRKALIVYLNSKVRVDKKTGFIDERDAVKVERTVRQKIVAGLGSDAVDVIVTVSRTEPILSTKRMPVDIGIIPFGYAEFIPTTIGLVNPALQAV